MADQSLNIIVKLTDQASGGLKSLGSKFDDMSDRVDKATEGAKKFTVATTAVGVAAGTYAVSRFMEFEKGMSAVQAVTGATGEVFDALGEKAKQIGRDTVYTQTEIAAAMEELGKQGLSAEQILNGAADSTANLASAAGTSLESAATIASSAMTVYNVKAEEMANVTNSIVGVANASKFSVEDFGLAMSQGGAVARQAGVSFEDFAGTLSAVASGFQSGSDAGTSMKTFLMRLVPSSDEAASAMESIGFSAYDAAGNMKSLEDIAQNLQEGLSGLTDEQKNYTLTTIFGSDASRMAGLMAEQGAKGIQKMKDVIANTDAEQQAKIRMDNLAGSWERLKGTVDVIAVSIGQALGEYVRPAIDAVADALENMQTWWAGLDQSTRNILTGLGLFVGTLAAIVFTVGALGLVLGPVLTAIGTIATSLGVLISPIGLIIAGIAALGWAFSTNFMGVRDAVMGAWATIQPVLVQIWTGFQDTFGKIMEYVELIKEPLMRIWGEIQPIIMDFLGSIGDFFSTTFLNIVSVISGSFDIIKGIFDIAFSLIAGVTTLFLQVITGDWTGAWETIKTTTSNVFEGIKLVISGAIEVIVAIFSQFWAGIKLGFSALWNTVRLGAEIAWTAITNIVSGYFTALIKIFDFHIELYSKAWNGFTDFLGTAMTTAWEGIKTTVANGINWVIDKINAAISLINAATSKIGGPQMSLIDKVAFQTGGIVPGFETGGIISGGKNPASHDKVPAMLDPGELILNRAQQGNIANQLTNGGNGGGGLTLIVELKNNTFHGADESYARQIAEIIFQDFNQHVAIPGF